MARELLAVVCSILFCELVMSAEQMCSKFDYELRTLEVMLRTEKQVETMLSEMKTLKESVTTELGEIQKFKADIATDMESMKDAIKALQVPNEKHQSKGPIVAFSVTNPTKSLVNGAPIFSDVITNTGRGYDENTGVFKAPADGLYLFVLTVASIGKYDVYCWLKLNDRKTVFSRTYSDNAYTSASGSAFLMLSTGDNVSVGDCVNWSKIYITDGIATFSGALIQQA